MPIIESTPFEGSNTGRTPDRRGRIIQGVNINPNPEPFALGGGALQHGGGVGFRTNSNSNPDGGLGGARKKADVASNLGRTLTSVGMYKANPYVLAAGVALQAIGTFASVFANTDPVETTQERIERERYERAKGIAQSSRVRRESDGGLANAINTYKRRDSAAKKRETRTRMLNTSANQARTQVEAGSLVAPEEDA